MDLLALTAEQKIAKAMQDSPVNINSQQDYYRKIVKRINLRSNSKK